MERSFNLVEYRRDGPGPRGFGARARLALAFTLIELCVAIAICSVIAALAVPSYSQHVERSRVSQAVSDILEMSLLLERYYSDHYSHPEDLGGINAAGRLDPWGRPYQYLNLQTATGKGEFRKNKKLNPINSDFDLYSMGKDGESAGPLSAKKSQDDVVRANDGRFVGLASAYTQ
ncbi:MAG: prepilin-type cleavage/methylation domain-containing protein [Burkholderiales bacterium]|nr:prepilin-type cleavage/methylation domain-containing protein [Burkholderiales bacterium]